MNEAASTSSLLAIDLPDGRTVSYARYGAPGGRPVLFCHGFPGSRLQAHYLAEAGEREGLEFIAPDRPGIGGSSPRSFRCIAEWAEDAAVLATELELGELAVVGVSGGGPYALALAARAPELVRAAVIVASPCEYARDALLRMRPLEATALRVAHRWPHLARLAIRRSFGGSRGRLGALQGRLDAVDRDVIASTHVSASLAANRAEAVARGTAALEHESVLYTRSWGFDLADIVCHTDIYCGTEDRLTPPFMAERLTARVPDSQLHLVEGHGHFTLLPAIANEIAALLGG